MGVYGIQNIALCPPIINNTYVRTTRLAWINFSCLVLVHSGQKNTRIMFQTNVRIYLFFFAHCAKSH